MLSPEERSRADAFRREVHARRYASGRGRLRELLAAYVRDEPAALELDEGPNGKPELRTGDLRFNLAHSEGLGLCAVSRGDVGVDVEVVAGRRRPDWRAIAERFFHEDELTGLGALADEPGWREFLRVWTLKEACLKATGLGLATDPRTFSVAHVLADRRGLVLVGGREWTCAEVDVEPRAVAALAAD